MTQLDEYDEIFSVLKHPVRRQILLFIEEQAEASFTQIQGNLSIEDTGLVSYHLKELSPMLEQSERGKYRLSEVGQAGVELLRKVDRERQRSNVSVPAEVEKYLNKTIIASVLFLGIAAFTIGIPLSSDIIITVRSVTNGFSFLELSSIFLAGALIMILGAAFFTVFDRHYWSKTTKANIAHTAVFAAGATLILGLTFFQLQSFNSGMAGVSSPVIPTYFGVLRAAGLMFSAPLGAYLLSKRKSNRKTLRPPPKN